MGIENEKCCATCIWHCMQTRVLYESTTSTSGILTEWFCNNKKSECFETFTMPTDSCTEWDGAS